MDYLRPALNLKSQTKEKVNCEIVDASIFVKSQLNNKSEKKTFFFLHYGKSDLAVVLSTLSVGFVTLMYFKAKYLWGHLNIGWKKKFSNPVQILNRNVCGADKNSEKMNHVQAVTVLESSYPEKNNFANRSGVTKRNILKDINNNEPQIITKESLNVATSDPIVEPEEPEEYTLLGFIKFKSPIKWLNTISIVLIHLIFIYGFISYPLHGKFLTTFWGKLSTLILNFNTCPGNPFRRLIIFIFMARPDRGARYTQIGRRV